MSVRMSGSRLTLYLGIARLHVYCAGMDVPVLKSDVPSQHTCRRRCRGRVRTHVYAQILPPRPLTVSLRACLHRPHYWAGTGPGNSKARRGWGWAILGRCGLYGFGLYSYGLCSYGKTTVLAYIVMAYIVMAYVVMAYVLMAFIVLAHIVLAYKVMALYSYGPIYVRPKENCSTSYSGLAPWYLQGT